VRRSDSERLVVFWAASSWDAPPGSDVHMATHLAKYATVLFVDPPTSWLRVPRPRRARPGRVEPVRLGPNLLRLSPGAPPGVSRPVVRETATWWSRRVVAHAVRRLGLPVHAVVVASLDHRFGVCDEERRVLYATDDYLSAADLMGLSARWVHHRARAQAAAATQVVAVSEPVAATWREFGLTVATIPNGCDAEAFAAPATPADDIGLPGPVAVVVGQLSERIDLAYLEATAATGVSVLLIGPLLASLRGPRLDALLARDNVNWIGSRPFAELPRYLASATVGLTPYADTPFNRASFPLKTLEYLAAGIPAVATDLPGVRALGTNLVAVAESPREFAEAVSRTLTDRDDPTLRTVRRAFASAHDWRLRAKDFAREIGLDSGGPEPAVPSPPVSVAE